MARKSRRNIEAGVGYLTQTLDLYDRFRQSLRDFSGTANWMLYISLGTFVCSLLYFSRFFVENGVVRYHLIPLSVIFFGISAVVFSLFRGSLYLVQSLVERSRGSTRSLLRRRIPSLRSQDVEAFAREVHGTLSGSVSLWWRAHQMTLRTVFILVPGFLFYFLGLASLLAYAITLIWAAP